MPVNRDKRYASKRSPCVDCGRPRWHTKGSLPAGQGRCQPCRVAARRALNERLKAARTKPCVTCGVTFTAEYAQTLYCSDDCRERSGKFRTRHQDKTAARGYGTEHKKARAQLLAELTPETHCPFCETPMLPTQLLDLDHSDPAARLRRDPGDRLAHASCNRAKRAKAEVLTMMCCAICGCDYRALPRRRTCSRACQVELLARNEAISA